MLQHRSPGGYGRVPPRPTTRSTPCPSSPAAPRCAGPRHRRRGRCPPTRWTARRPLPRRPGTARRPGGA